jgi:hypothetical protein
VHVTSDADLTGCDSYVTFRQGRRTVTVKAGEPIEAKLAPGGGYIVRLTPEK